jgi:non-ribosomal peptide synthetase component F
VEAMVGLFVNTLPMRIRLHATGPLASWLEEIQQQQLEMQKYQYSPLADVQQWSELPRGEALFESIFAFGNFPTPNMLLRGEEVVLDSSFEKTNYPLTLMVGPGKQLIVRVLYDELRTDHTTIKLLLRHFQSVLENMAAGFDRPLSAIEILTPVESEQLLDDFNADLEEVSI